MLQLVCFLVRETQLSLVGGDQLLQSRLHVLLGQVLICLALNELPAPTSTTWRDRAEVISTAVLVFVFCRRCVQAIVLSLYLHEVDKRLLK